MSDAWELAEQIENSEQNFDFKPIWAIDIKNDEEAYAKLQAVGKIKKTAIQHYFQTIHDQILTFSENRMIVEAMIEFHENFRNFRDENNLTKEKIEEIGNCDFVMKPFTKYSISLLIRKCPKKEGC